MSISDRAGTIQSARAILFMVLGLACLGVEARAKSNEVLLPQGAQAALLSLGGKEIQYFQLARAGEIKLMVDGPAELTILSRLGYPTGASGSQTYTLEIAENGKVFTTHTSTTEKSDGLFKDTTIAAGKSRKWTVTVPRGRHGFQFLLQGTSAAPVFLRFLANSQAGSVSWVSVTPLSYTRVATAMVKEKPVLYFVATTQGEVRLRVVGPLQLRISSRLSFDARMTGEQNYAVLVLEKAKNIVTEPLSTPKSAGVVYTDWKEMVPGESQIFTMEVPSGEHTYSFLLGKGIAQSVALRFFIPKDKI